jgi:hypothetical protein
MKTILSISLFLLLFIGVNAQIDQKVERSFKKGSNPELSIKNSFGDIKINTHNSEIIEVLVEINVVPSNKRNYEKVRDKVRIDVKEIGNRVELITISDLDGISTEEMSIDYTVLIPENTLIEVVNQFGDVWIEGTGSKVNARVQHGDMYAGVVKGKDSQIKIQFGDLRLESVQKAELDIQHGDLRAENLTDVKLDLQFSDARINELNGELIVKSQHSDLKIENVSKSVTLIEIDGQFSDITFESGPWSEFRMDMEGGFTDISIPHSVKSLVNYHSEEMHTEEYRINEKEIGKRIIINANHSDVDFD